ncbi:drug/metabolite transporter (DMT)-like permease [Gracilibacillus halotolerans]|uniref:Drug/metabolite transporter (DMT)-like permease n=1 Tax=Gracilibacillus halotolerans TaxID=74386 RepID=A0A841RMK8_9BACI|nr:drug/metabolite transporter (DMT)-like permease [Gracilibacillus halotolerans]
MKNKLFIPYTAVVIGVIALSLSAIFVRLIEEAPVAITASYRLLLAGIILFPYVFLKKRKELKNLGKREGWIAILAGISLAIHFILWFESLQYTSVASSVVLVTLQPIFAFIGTYLFFKERFSSATIISMLIAIFGSFVIVMGDFQLAGDAFYGDMLALTAALFITIYFLIGQQIRSKTSVTTYTFIAYTIGGLFLLIYSLLKGYPLVEYPANDWLFFILLAIIPTIFGLNLLNWSLKWFSTSLISMAIILEPIGASAFAYLLFNETITWSQWLGGTIIIFGLFLFVTSTKRERNMRLTVSKHDK